MHTLEKQKTKKYALIGSQIDPLKNIYITILKELGYKIDITKTKEEIEKKFQTIKYQYDIAILNLTTPENLEPCINALELIRTKHPEVATIITTNFDQELSIEKITQFHADQFLSKLSNKEEQFFRIRIARIARDKRNKKEQHIKKMENEIYHDALTNIFNRNAYEQHIQNYIADIVEKMCPSIPCTIVLVDIDNFKNVNDTLGHDAGDHVLKKIAQTLKESTRDTDFIARLGGAADEFVIIALNTNKKQAEFFVNKLHDNINQSEIIYGNKKIKTTISIGYTYIERDSKNIQEAIIAIQHKKNKEEILQRWFYKTADDALRKSKQQKNIITYKRLNNNELPD